MNKRLRDDPQPGMGTEVVSSLRRDNTRIWSLTLDRQGGGWSSRGCRLRLELGTHTRLSSGTYQWCLNLLLAWVPCSGSGTLNLLEACTGAILDAFFLTPDSKSVTGSC